MKADIAEAGIQHGPVCHEVTVEFGDCDPAGIVYFPNFLRWMDAASRRFFSLHGIPPWYETTQTHGIIGTPMVRLQVNFRAPAVYGEHLHVRTRISRWGRSSFTMVHRLQRGDHVLVEAEEVRVFAARVDRPAAATDARSGGIRAVPVPPDWRAQCEVPTAKPISQASSA